MVRPRYFRSSAAASLMETWRARRTSQVWETGGSHLLDAAWGSDDTVVILMFENRVGALHFVREAPSFVAQLLPLDLGLTSPHDTFEGIVWDAERQRVAVCSAERHTCGSGRTPRRATVYALQTRPVMTATPIRTLEEPESSCEPSGWRATPLLAGSSLVVCWGSHLSSLAL